MALYIPHSIFHLALLLYVRPETFGPYYVYHIEYSYIYFVHLYILYDFYAYIVIILMFLNVNFQYIKIPVLLHNYYTKNCLRFTT